MATAPVPAPAPAISPELEASLALTNALVEVRNQLGDHLLNHPGDPDATRLENLRRQADRAIIALSAQSIELLGADNAEALRELKAVTERGQAFIQRIESIQRGLKVAASLITLAASVFIGDASGVLGAIRGVKKALKDDEAEDKKAGPAAVPG